MSLLGIAIGMALGAAYVASAAVRTALAPFTALAHALRPLLVPLGVLAVAGTYMGAWYVQAPAGFLLVIIVSALIVAPEREALRKQFSGWWDELEGGRKVMLKRTGVGLPPVVLVVLYTVVKVLGAPYSGQGGLPGTLLVIALLITGFALVARLVGYATTPLRGTVAFLLGVCVLFVLMAGGVVREVLGAGDATLVVAGLAGATLVVAIALEGSAKRFRPTTDELTYAERFKALGLTLGLLAGVLLALGSTVSLIELSTKGEANPLSAETGFYVQHDASPAYVRAPVLAFTADQPWTPTAVDRYVAESKVIRADGTQAAPGDDVCPSVGPRSCLRRTSNCPSADQPCALRTPHQKGDRVTDGAIYVRTLKRPLPSDHSDDAIARRALFGSVRTPIATQTETLIQYWLYYPYDEWTTEFMGGKLTQRHESDWENVSVGLGAGDAPLFVAYSAHCGGKWRYWKDAEHAGTHPLVAVANGSQANYPDAGDKRVPDWTSCSHLPRGIGTLLSYAANVRDRTSDDFQWGAARLIDVDETTAPMNFPGSWGGHDETVFTNLIEHRTAPGGGPKSPPLQDLWAQPFDTIFCNHYWSGPQDCVKR